VLLHGVLGFSPLLWGAVLFEGGRRIADAFDLDVRDLIGVAEHNVAPRLTLALIGAALLAVLLLGVLVGVVRALLKDYGFRLTHSEGRFRITRGLLQRFETVIVDRRIQLGVIRRRLIAGAFGWRSVDLQTLGGSDVKSGRHEAAPLARPEEAAEVITAAGLPLFAVERLARVDARHGTRLAVWRSALVLVPVVALAVLVTLPALWGVLLLVPVVALSLRAPRYHRFTLEEGALHVAQGMASRRAWIVPVASVQAVTIRRGPLQRLFGLVTVAADTAGGSGKHRPDVVDLRVEDGKGLAGALVG